MFLVAWGCFLKESFADVHVNFKFHCLFGTLTLLHSKKAKIVYSFDLSECNRVKG